MSYAKLNRLHWHVADDQSWPLESTKYPELSRKGALTPDSVYSPDDVAGIVQYAQDRGILVYPEFDLPAHASAWGKGYPELVVSCPGGQPLVDPRDVAGGIYDVIDGLLEEFLPVFSASFVHFGGDEVHSFRCWDESPAVQAWAQSQGLRNSSDIRNYFQKRLQLIAQKRGASVVFWQEVYDARYELLSSSVIDIWLDNARFADVLRAGHRAVQSFGYYLDRQIPGNPNRTHYFWQDTIKDFFLHDPLRGSDLTPEEESRALGLSMSMWGEQVDSSNIHSRMWPRALGGAARAWSDAGVRDVAAAFPLMERARCMLVQRGIAAGPLHPDSPDTHCHLPAHVAKQLDGLHWDAVRLRAQASGGGAGGGSPRDAASAVLMHRTLAESRGHAFGAVLLWAAALSVALVMVAAVAVRGRGAQWASCYTARQHGTPGVAARRSGRAAHAGSGGVRDASEV